MSRFSYEPAIWAALKPRPNDMVLNGDPKLAGGVSGFYQRDLQEKVFTAIGL